MLKSRREPKVEAPRAREGELHPDVATMFNSIASTRDERDRLRIEVSELHELLAKAKRENDFLENRLAEAEHKRDFYQHHYVALHVRLSDLDLTIENHLRNIETTIQSALSNVRLVVQNAITEAKRDADASGIDQSGGEPERAGDKGTEAVEDALTVDPIVPQPKAA